MNVPKPDSKEQAANAITQAWLHPGTDQIAGTAIIMYDDVDGEWLFHHAIRHDVCSIPDFARAVTFAESHIKEEATE